MTVASDLVEAERRLKKIDELICTLANPHLGQYGFEIIISGFTFNLNGNAAPECINFIRANLEREELNLKALLRKHKLIE